MIRVEEYFLADSVTFLIGKLGGFMQILIGSSGLRMLSSRRSEGSSLALGNNNVAVRNDPTRLQNTLLESVDEGLLALGETGREALYQCIQSKYQLTREEIPDNLETFHQALQDLDAGAKIIEKLIVKNLYTTLGLKFTERANWTLIDHVNNLRQAMNGPVSEHREDKDGCERKLSLEIET